MSESGTDANEKRPSAPVTAVCDGVPEAVTVAPITASPSGSETVPARVRAMAGAVPEANNVMSVVAIDSLHICGWCSVCTMQI